MNQYQFRYKFWSDFGIAEEHNLEYLLLYNKYIDLFTESHLLKKIEEGLNKEKNYCDTQVGLIPGRANTR